MSGIYIPNMELPKCCDDCPICYCLGGVWELGDFVCSLKDITITDRYTRHANCPLVAVPDHGRLIDAGDLYDGIDKKTTAFRADVENQKISQATEFGYWGAIHDVRAVLTNAPTIIPADKEDGDG